MPHFFIDIDLGDLVAADEDGADYANLQAARSEMLAALADLVKTRIADGTDHDFVATVRDANGRHVLSATLSLTIEAH